MNWEAIGAVGEIIGAIAVFATLAYLAVQVKQANRIADVSNVKDIYERLGAVNFSLAVDADLGALLIRGSKADQLADLSDTDRIRLQGWIRNLCNIWVTANIARDSGQLSDRTFNMLFDDAAANIKAASPAMLVLWKRVRKSYPANSELEIVQFIRSLKREVARTETQRSS